MPKRPGIRVFKRMRAIDANRLASFRAELQLNQNEFADRAGLGTAQVSRAEQGANVSLTTAEIIASTLRQPVEKLFEYVFVTSGLEHGRVTFDATPPQQSETPELVSPANSLVAKGSRRDQGRDTARQPSIETEDELDGEERFLRTPLGSISSKLLFCYPGGHVNAVRLYGRGNSYVSPERLFLTYRHERYEPPSELKKAGEERIARLQREARSKNGRFFNGPSVRLLHWHRNQQGARESDSLRLVLGPIGWFDYEGTNGLISERLKQGIPDAYDKYANLEKIMQLGDIEKWCRLSNNVGNAITIFTRDGKVGYQIRGQHLSADPGYITSSVAENINRYWDDTDPDSQEIFNDFRNRDNLESEPDDGYRPKGIPHLLAAVRRGVEEETSQRLIEHIGPFGIKLTGLAFGLDVLAPDALWIVLMDITEEKFQELRRDDPGKDADEGDLKFVPANFEEAATQRILERLEWVPAGKASLIRAIQLIGAIDRKHPEAAFDILANAR